MTSSDYFATIFQSELVGDVAVPLSVRQAVLFWALRSPDARPRLNWRRSSSTVLSQVCLGRPGRRLQFLGAGDICRLVKHGNDLETCRPGPRGQTTSSVWSAQCLIAVADQYADGLRNSLHTPTRYVQDTPKTPLMMTRNDIADDLELPLKVISISLSVSKNSLGPCNVRS